MPQIALQVYYLSKYIPKNSDSMRKHMHYISNTIYDYPTVITKLSKSPFKHAGHQKSCGINFAMHE